MLVCCESENTLNRAYLIILNFTAVYNHDSYNAHISSASASCWYVIRYVKNKAASAFGNNNTVRKFFNNGYRKYRDLRSINSINIMVDNISANSNMRPNMTGPKDNFQFLEP